MPFEEAVVDQPSTETAETVETTEAAQESSAEATTEETQLGETQSDGTEADADWLPDEQLKVFPDEQYERYAQKRYPDLVALLKDENSPEPTRKAVRQILHDKINSDIEIGKFKSQPQEEEATEEAEETENQPQVQVTPQQHEQIVNQFVDQVTNPEVAKKFVTEFTKAFEVKDPEQRAIAVTKSLTKAVVNLFPDLVNAYLFAQPGKQGLLDQYIESRYEGLGATVEQTGYSRAWDDMIASDPKLSSLPAYDSRPNSEWTKAIAKVAEMVPGFEEFTIQGASKSKNFAAKARIAAQLLSSGGNATAIATAQQAVETGKRIANEANKNKQLGKLGAGQSKGQITVKPSNDPLKDSIAAHRQENNPFAALGQVK